MTIMRIWWLGPASWTLLITLGLAGLVGVVCALRGDREVRRRLWVVVVLVGLVLTGTVGAFAVRCPPDMWGSTLYYWLIVLQDLLCGGCTVYCG